MHRKSRGFAGLALVVAAVAFVLGGPVERLLNDLFLGLPAAFFLSQCAVLWIAYRVTGQARYRA